MALRYTSFDTSIYEWINDKYWLYIYYNYLRSYAYLDGLQIEGNFGSLKITDVCFSSSAY